jgi:hypothetical protein
MPRFAAFLLLLVSASACDASPTGGPCGPPSAACAARNCTTQVEHFDYEDCCDSLTCNCNPRTKEWEPIFCDPPPPPDAGAADATFDATPVPDADVADATRP